MNDRNENAPAVIRDLRVDDYERVLALWEAAGLPSRPKGRDARAAIERQLHEPAAVYLVAEVDGELVGVVLGTHDGRKGWVNRLAVSPSYRRRGLAGELLAEVERRLAALGIEIFACLIENWNEGSKVFFEESGYKRFGEVSYYTKRKHDGV